MNSCIDILKAQQRRNGTRVYLPENPRVGFAFNTKDRVDFTIPTLASIDTGSGFDLIWADGSDTPQGKQLPYEYKLRNARLVEIHSDVRGGPDRAICFCLRRLLDLGYDYCGLIENDMVFAPGWYQTLMEVFGRAASDGVVCGAATVRGFQSRALEYREGYYLCWNVGAGMVLFTRPAAELLLAKYRTLEAMRSRAVYRYYCEIFGVDLHNVWELWGDLPDRPLGMDWGYSPLLYSHGYASAGSIPSVVRDLEFDVSDFLRTEYVGVEQQKSGLAVPLVSPESRRRMRQMRATDPFFKLAWWAWRTSPRLRRWARSVNRKRKKTTPPQVVRSPGATHF